jgi:hypothetical protein
MVKVINKKISSDISVKKIRGNNINNTFTSIHSCPNAIIYSCINATVIYRFTVVLRVDHYVTTSYTNETGVEVHIWTVAHMNPCNIEQQIRHTYFFIILSQLSLMKSFIIIVSIHIW